MCKVYITAILLLSFFNSVAQRDESMKDSIVHKVKLLTPLEPRLEVKFRDVSDSSNSIEASNIILEAEELLRPPTTRYYESQKNAINISDKTKWSTLQPNSIIRLPNISFQPGRRYLVDGGLIDLANLYELLNTKPTMKIEIQGHICCKKNGEDGYDVESSTVNLSFFRAKLIAQYLIKLGVSSTRIISKGFGSSRKLYFDDFNNLGFAKYNRRVDVRIVEL